MYSQYGSVNLFLGVCEHTYRVCKCHENESLCLYLQVILILTEENLLTRSSISHDHVPVSARLYGIVGADRAALGRRALQVFLPYHA